MCMVWSGKHPPEYCFHNDYWRRETDHELFQIDCINKQFVGNDEVIPFTKKCKIVTIRKK